MLGERRQGRIAVRSSGPHALTNLLRYAFDLRRSRLQDRCTRSKWWPFPNLSRSQIFRTRAAVRPTASVEVPPPGACPPRTPG